MKINLRCELGILLLQLVQGCALHPDTCEHKRAAVDPFL